MNANELKIGRAVVVNGHKGTITHVYSGGEKMDGLVNVRLDRGLVCVDAADITAACCDGASRDCTVHGDGN
jgi:hypothetical protein